MNHFSFSFTVLDGECIIWKEYFGLISLIILIIIHISALSKGLMMERIGFSYNMLTQLVAPVTSQ